MTSGQGMQVVQVLEDHSYQLDEKLLEQVLLKPDIKELPVVVVSVAGAYRGGKSFLLNFFIRYLSASESSQQDGSWLGVDSAPLLGFNWRGGAARNTTGILMWSEPFITTAPTGEKVAVLLMDTQGTFDSESTVRDNSTIFALSTLLSSVQIYNLSKNIQEDHLQHLQLFTMYGKMVQEMDNGEKAFQTLGFLVRDWPYPYDFPFGLEGGEGLLQERLKISPKQAAELQELRAHLKACFEDVFCFLMPHPGFKVEHPDYKGNINDIEPNFRVHLQQLVSSLFITNQLCLKTINGQKLKAGELFNYFKAYMSIFNSDKIPNPKSIVQATIEASLLSAQNEARDVYEKRMESECGPTQQAVSPDDLTALHCQYIDSAKQAFVQKKSMASEADIYKNLDALIKELENRLPQFEQSNLSKLQAIIAQATDAYQGSIHMVTNNQPFCLHPMDLVTVYDQAVEAAVKKYDGQVKKISDKPDTKKAELIQGLQNRRAELTLVNDKNNKDAVKDLFAEYKNTMNNNSQHPPLSEVNFKNVHDAALRQALNQFQTRRNRPNNFPTDQFKEELEKTITDTFHQLQAINQGKIEQERIRIEQERIKAEQERQEQLRIQEEKNRLELERQRIEQERVLAEQKQEQERIFREQEAARVQQERDRIDQERQKLADERVRLAIESSRNHRRNKGCEIAFGIVNTFANAAIGKLFDKK